MQNFIKTTFIYGIFALLPLILLYIILKVIYDIVGLFTTPTVELLGIAKIAHGDFLGNVILIIILIIVAFIMGLFLQTSIGKVIFDVIEERIFKLLPGYSILRTAAQQFGSENQSIGSGTKVVLVDLYNSQTLCTGFLVDDSNEMLKTIYIPSALHPFQGTFYLVETQRVFNLDGVKTDEGFKSVIACGVGADKFCNIIQKKYKEFLIKKGDSYGKS